MKEKNTSENHQYLLYRIILSGDVHSNPGPTGETFLLNPHTDARGDLNMNGEIICENLRLLEQMDKQFGIVYDANEEVTHEHLKMLEIWNN